MLLCEQFRGRHQRCLISVLDGEQRCEQRDDGLAAAHVALKQSMHPAGAAHVRHYLAERMRLRPRESVRQRFAKRGRELAMIGESDPAARFAPAEPVTPDMNAILQALPDTQREVVVMLKVLGMTIDEVARATSSSAGSVKQKAHRAYEKLREVLVGASRK